MSPPERCTHVEERKPVVRRWALSSQWRKREIAMRYSVPPEFDALAFPPPTLRSGALARTASSGDPGEANGALGRCEPIAACTGAQLDGCTNGRCVLTAAHAIGVRADS